MIPQVPFLDLGATYRELQPELDEVYRRVMTSGWYLLGEELSSFEAEFATYSGSRHCAGVASGLDALVLGLRALGVGRGDEVIVPANTYIATWLAVSAVGAKLVPVEPDPATYNLDPTACAAAITERTRVIIPVHLYGQPADMTPILELAAARSIRVLSDAAQAHGATYRGQPVGAFGDVTAWSFYPGKNLGAFADAGAVTTNDPEVDARVRLLRNYGSVRKYENEAMGVNSRLDELQAAFLRVKLKHLDEWNKRRSRTAERYGEALTDAPIRLPAVHPEASSSWHLFVIRHPGRDELQRRLSAMGVDTMIHYPIPPYRQRAYANLRVEANFPITDALHREVLSLPIGPHLTEGDRERVVEALIHSLNGLPGSTE